MESRVGLVAGALLLVVGASLLVGAEQHVYTIDTNITWPAAALLAIGTFVTLNAYRRMLAGIVEPPGSLVRVGVVVGIALGTGSVAWQFIQGVGLVLDLWIAIIVLLLGTGLVVLAAQAKIRRFAARGLPEFTHRALGIGAGLLIASTAILSALMANLGWLSGHATSVDPEYQAYVVEFLVVAAWLSFAGFTGVLDAIATPYRRYVRAGGVVAGLLGVGIDWSWFRSSTLYPELATLVLILAGALAVGTIGIAVTRGRATRRPSPLSPGR